MTTEEQKHEQDKEWARGINRYIAHNMRTHRKEQGVTVQQLSERTKELGYELPKATLTNIELERKTSVSIQEVLIISRALNIAPADLLADSHTPVAPVELYPQKILPSALAFHDLSRDYETLGYMTPLGLDAWELPGEDENYQENLNRRTAVDQVINHYQTLLREYSVYYHAKNGDFTTDPRGRTHRMSGEVLNDYLDVYAQRIEVTERRLETALKELTKAGIEPFSLHALWGDNLMKGIPLPDILKPDSELFNAPRN